MLCPQHKEEMLSSQTIYGTRWACPVHNCTYVSWGNAPAEKETRMARQRAHAVFDPLWKSGILSRAEAYRWLSKHIGLPIEETHIANMNIEQCNHVFELTMELRSEIKQFMGVKK